MATRKYSVARGATRNNAVVETTGTAITAGRLVEVTIDLAVNASEREVLNALDTIKRRVRNGNWPPA